MIRFYTDPHLGVSRAANTTQTSSKALQDALYNQAILASSGGVLTVCLGDMFDSLSNSELIHQQGMDIMRKTHMTLSGNHDVVNQAEKLGTLEVLNAHYGALTGTSRALFSEFGEPAAHSWKLDDENAVLVFVPHVATQALFFESLNKAYETVNNVASGVSKILCLHCNYDFPEERLNETTLNLTSIVAEQLFKRFDYILMGHEHMPAEHFDGRLIILGNTHPTSLGDISDKRIALFEDGKFTFQTIWEKSMGYAEFQAGSIPTMTTVNFARVKGEVDSVGMLEVMKEVAAMWRKSPHLYALKMEVTMAGAPAGGQAIVTGLAQLPDLIRKELEGTPDLLALWDELKGE